MPGAPDWIEEEFQPPLALMEIHIRTLFRCDLQGRLQSVNEWGDPPAPRFFMGGTPEGSLCRFRYDVPPGTVEHVEQLCKSEPPDSNHVGAPRHQAAIKLILEEHAPIQDEEKGPAYWIPATVEWPANVVLITKNNAHLLQTGFPWMLPLPHDREFGPVAATVAGGIAVSVCYCARLADQAAEAGVETMESYRGRGYATAAVASWATVVRRRGLIPLYSTTWDNLASQGVARKLGMVLHGADWSLG
jgi:GNAT superfamily N-acetyltransferase